MKQSLPEYSVLMSVYFKETAGNLRESMMSICRQSFAPNDFVLVCDGPLTPELDAVIDEMQELFGDVLAVLRLEKNGGLGKALNAGLQQCKNEIVIRMDSDDISAENRCRMQVGYLEQHPDVDILSGTVEEFFDSIDSVFGKRELPCEHKSICTFSKKRNPFNHPATAFRKKAVFAAGSYDETFHLFEDYYLWIRMLMKGFRGHNLNKTLVYMRTPPDMYKRRGGFQYAEDMLRFHWWMKMSGWSSMLDFLTGAVPHAVVCILPNHFRKIFYEVLHK